ncbi:division/cell wall cluster transcriptional repressor MraZ [Dokdonia donghaensis]|uniref:Transcriptional regulator MraZ n=1 Tax=Dokdonia donghaensis DSW-1 TaxID=1300343 RepID=A0A0A2GYV6_9FLAO|nr:division/cell wall cluster transcriptional repressor MraZ [Dokdonia donghaensis]ANH60234.1 cell division protein MraZ [Dokdonia donghaensis DSW-1]KGO07521.1 MraZ family transcriptional regulator [Dokdonia donghaensis DSW-1]
MINLIGTYECKIDAKGRLMLPQAFKKQLAPILQDGFVLKRAVFQKCLELYPIAEWNVLSAKVNKLNRFKKKNDEFIRRFNAGVKPVEVDGTGRILVSKDLGSFAKLEKSIVVNAAFNILEIWDKDLYEKAIDEAAVDFADLAEEVMGDSDIPDGLS